MAANKTSFGGLDALRGVLSIAVCIAHAWHTFVAPFFPADEQGIALVFGILARLAVISFFCLSGYVIAMSIAKNVERHGSFDLMDYVIARGFRILPPLLLVIVLVFLATVGASYFGFQTLPQGVSTVRDVLRTDIGSQFLAIVTLALRGDLTGYLNGPLWTLAFEVQLYAIAGLLVFGFFASRYHVLVRIAAIVLSLVFIRRFLPISTQIAILSNLMWLCFFVFGAAAFIWRKFFSKKVAGCILVVGGVLFLAITSQIPLQEFTSRIDTGHAEVLSQLAYGIASTGALILLSMISAPLFMRELGKFSYSLYIFHFPIIIFCFFLIERVQPISTIVAALTWGVLVVIIAILASWQLAKLIERPVAQRAFARKLLTTIINRQLFRLPR